VEEPWESSRYGEQVRLYSIGAVQVESVKESEWCTMIAEVETDAPLTPHGA
jgi:hypothetical protein